MFYRLEMATARPGKGKVPFQILVAFSVLKGPNSGLNEPMSDLKMTQLG